MKICFDREQEDILLSNFNNSKHILELSYATSWFEENRDYPTLLNNFIHVFQYTDMCFRSCFPIRPSENRGFFASMFFRGIDDYYNRDTSYQLYHMMHTAQMSWYYGWLANEGLHLELIFKWFFEEYLPVEFGVEGFFLSSCHEKSTYAEKCKSLVIEIERVLKQFKIYIEEGYVDSELMDVSSGAIRFEDVPSLCQDKYIYPHGDECENIKHLLFSDQSHLSLLKHERYDNFAQAVHNDALNYNEFHDFQKVNLDYLLEKQVIEIGSCGNITADIDIVGLLDDLHRNQVCCFSYMRKYVGLVDSFKTKGWIEFESTLFTRPEQEYLDYVMNNSKFTNSLGLRNKYCHGAYPISETQNHTDYLEILKVMILVIIKINEEFCLSADCKEHITSVKQANPL